MLRKPIDADDTELAAADARASDAEDQAVAHPGGTQANFTHVQDPVLREALEIVWPQVEAGVRYLKGR